ncbi:hypothetical protein L6164_036146 [Bauhinia variegata]|uniref:Uncharacterized protein n=1 Tax=Bauhinia variegata TaxID=167791 RepID=A0ACB9KG57_BAUVA|nr:hypothetical protein L6164_036146 [Bauhinia variegata]
MNAERAREMCTKLGAVDTTALPRGNVWDRGDCWSHVSFFDSSFDFTRSRFPAWWLNLTVNPRRYLFQG